MPTVGGEIDAFCTRCKLTLAHTVLAMVGTKVARVRCNTCGGDHSMRGDPNSKSASSRTTGTPKTARVTKEDRVVISFEQQLQGKDIASAPRYSPKVTFAVDQVLSHPTFGIGIVRAVRGDKIDVAFKADEKTLVHARGEASSTEKPEYHPPVGSAQGPSDKPQVSEE